MPGCTGCRPGCRGAGARAAGFRGSSGTLQKPPPADSTGVPRCKGRMARGRRYKRERCGEDPRTKRGGCCAPAAGVPPRPAAPNTRRQWRTIAGTAAGRATRPGRRLPGAGWAAMLGAAASRRALRGRHRGPRRGRRRRITRSAIRIFSSRIAAVVEDSPPRRWPAAASMHRGGARPCLGK